MADNVVGFFFLYYFIFIFYFGVEKGRWRNWTKIGSHGQFDHAGLMAAWLVMYTLVQ